MEWKWVQLLLIVVVCVCTLLNIINMRDKDMKIRDLELKLHDCKGVLRLEKYYKERRNMMKTYEASISFSAAHLKPDSLKVQVDNVKNTLAHTIGKELMEKGILKFSYAWSGNKMVVTVTVKAEE